MNGKLLLGIVVTQIAANSAWLYAYTDSQILLAVCIFSSIASLTGIATECIINFDKYE